MLERVHDSLMSCEKADKAREDHIAATTSNVARHERWREIMRVWNKRPFKLSLTDHIPPMITSLWHHTIASQQADQHAFRREPWECSVSLPPSPPFTPTLKEQRLDTDLALAHRHYREFLTHAINRARLSTSAMVLALKYVQRLRQQNSADVGGPGSEFRLLVIGVMLANKTTEDVPHTNRSWAIMTGMPIGELNLMEREFLAAIDYELYVHEEEFQGWALNLCGRLALGGECPGEQRDGEKSTLAIEFCPKHQIASWKTRLDCPQCFPGNALA